MFSMSPSSPPLQFPRPLAVPLIDPSLLVAAKSNQQKATTYLTQKDGTKWKVRCLAQPLRSCPNRGFWDSPGEVDWFSLTAKLKWSRQDIYPKSSTFLGPPPFPSCILINSTSNTPCVNTATYLLCCHSCIGIVVVFGPLPDSNCSVSFNLRLVPLALSAHALHPSIHFPYLSFTPLNPLWPAQVERDLQGNEIITPLPSFESQFFVIDDKPDINICTVIPGLHIGSQDAATNVQGLHEKGVTHILNVAFYISNPFSQEFTCETIEVADEPGANITALFPRCFDFINAALAAGGGVLVHWYVKNFTWCRTEKISSHIIGLASNQHVSPTSILMALMR